MDTSITKGHKYRSYLLGGKGNVFIGIGVLGCRGIAMKQIQNLYLGI